MSKDHYRVLVIDTDTPFLHLIHKFLMRKGIAAVTVINTADALLAMAKHCFDAILVDVPLHAENGIDFLIKSQKGHPEIPVVVMTNMSCEEGIFQDSLKGGASGCVCKDAGISNIVVTLVNAIRGNTFHDRPLLAA